MEGGSANDARAAVAVPPPVAAASSVSSAVLRRPADPIGTTRTVSEDVVIGGVHGSSSSGSPSSSSVHDVRSALRVSTTRDDPAQISNSTMGGSADAATALLSRGAAHEQTEQSLAQNQPPRRAAGGNFLVSEQEDEGGPPFGGPDDDESNAHGAGGVEVGVGHRRDLSLVRVRPASVDGGGGGSAAAGGTARQLPAEIPRNADEVDEGKDADGEDEEDESDYEYEYEDEDEGHYSGFIMSEPHASVGGGAPPSSASATAAPQDAGTHKVEDDEDEKPPAAATSIAATAAASSSSAVVAVSEKLGGSPTDPQQLRKARWREPSRSAVSMSLRAESEKTGGKRRLAADLYKIMMADTDEAGFQIEPKCEDSMDRWTIRLFAFDEDSNLSKDLMVLGLDHVELEMSFPEQYPFEPPFVRVVRPRFKRQTGFVMNGALCMELLTREGWNPVNDIESVIVSVRSLLVVGDGRLQAAVDLPERRREALLAAARERRQAEHKRGAPGNDDRSDDEDQDGDAGHSRKKQRRESGDVATTGRKDGAGGGGGSGSPNKDDLKPISKSAAGSYTTAEARAAYSHLSDYHKKKGWDSSGWWARKG